MIVEELKSKLDVINLKIGDAKTEVLKLEDEQAQLALKLLDARKRLTALFRQRDDLTTPDMFA